MPLVNRGAGLRGQALPASRGGDQRDSDWCHIIPIGDFPHPESGALQVIDEAALRSMENRFRQERRNPDFGGLLVDYDHQSYDPSRSSAAAGWIHDLQRRRDGLWANINWTPQGRADVRNRRFNFVSPVWLTSDLQGLGGGRVRPLRLDSIGLTNAPNLRGMKPVNNRASQVPGEGTPTCDMTSEVIRRDASDLVAALVNRHRQRDGATFARAWRDIHNRNPFLAKLSRWDGDPILANRALSSLLPSAIFSEADLNLIGDLEPDVKASWKRMHARSGMPYFRGASSVYSRFGKEAQRVLPMVDGDLDKAWERIREDLPLVWAAFVLVSSGQDYLGLTC